MFVLHTERKICNTISTGIKAGVSMLFYYVYLVKYLCIGALILSLFVAVCAGYAYSVNAQRSQEDPEKRNYPPGAWILAIFTWPILLPIVISLFLIRVLLYSLFIIVFSVLLLIIPRETPEPTRVESEMTKIGNALLEANTFLIKLMLRPWIIEPEAV